MVELSREDGDALVGVVTGDVKARPSTNVALTEFCWVALVNNLDVFSAIKVYCILRLHAKISECFSF